MGIFSRILEKMVFAAGRHFLFFSLLTLCFTESDMFSISWRELTAMESSELIWRYIFWVGTVLILIYGGWECYRERQYLNHRRIMRKGAKWGGILVGFAFVCFLFCPRYLVTYGETWWLQGQIVDRETRKPVEGVYIVFSCYRPAPWNREFIDERFADLKSWQKSEGMTSHTLLRGVTNHEGRFFAIAGYMSGDVPFGYPFWGSLSRKDAWMFVRKEGYASAEIQLKTNGWRHARHGYGEPDGDELNEISVTALIKEHSPG